MRKQSFFITLAFGLVCLFAYGAELEINKERISKLQAEISVSIGASMTYQGESMSLPRGYSQQEWKQAETDYLCSISKERDSLQLPYLYERLAITYMAQQNYDNALVSLENALHIASLYGDDDEDIYTITHHLYLDIAAIEKLRGNKQQVAQAFMNSLTYSNYFYFSPTSDKEIIMQEIYHKWWPKDKAFQRFFYEYYLATYKQKVNNYASLVLFANNLKKLYSAADNSQRNCVDVVLCINDTTLSPSDQLQQLKHYKRAIAKQKIFTFAGKQYYNWFTFFSPFSCENLNCNDETIKNNLDTIDYEERIDEDKYWLQVDQLRLDSLRLAKGYRSAEYRNALAKFTDQHRRDIGCEMVLTYLEQLHQWDSVTPQDIQWIEDSLKISKPLELSTEEEFFDDEWLERFSYFCYSSEWRQKYNDLFLPLVARAYGPHSATYYSYFLSEATDIAQHSFLHGQEPDIDSLHWDEAIMLSKPIQPRRIPVVEKNVDKVRKEWKGEGSDNARLNVYFLMSEIGTWTCNAELLQSVLTIVQEWQTHPSLPQEMQDRVLELLAHTSFYLAILQKDIPLFHQSVQLYRQLTEGEVGYIDHMLADYLYGCQQAYPQF